MMRKLAAGSACLFAATLFIACGGGQEKSESTAPPKADEPTASDKAGVAMGTEIIETFDAAVAACADVLKDKPAWVEAQPKLDAVQEEYAGKMADLHAKHKALEGEDVFAWRTANGYISDNRPKHVHAINTAFQDVVGYYRFEKGVKGFDELLDKLPKLLDPPVAQ